MVAGATVAGFAAAAVFVPSKEDQALRRLAAMERALMPGRPSTRGHREDNGDDSGEDGGAKNYSRGRTGFMGAIGRQVLEAIKPAVMSALTAGITAKAATSQGEQAPPPSGSDPNQASAQGQQGSAPGDPSAAI